MSEQGITAIVTAYRRPENVGRIVEALKSQTVPPKEIMVWQNFYEGIPPLSFDGVVSVYSSKNFKFHGRFALAWLARTEHVCIFDDDTIPGPKWFEVCLEHMARRPAVLAPVGLAYFEDLHDVTAFRAGWNGLNDEGEIEVDIAGHSWFFKREWLSYFWQELPFNWSNGEDIQLSFACKMRGIPTIIPPHPPHDRSVWGSIDGELGADEVAASLIGGDEFLDQRVACVKEGVRRGWKTLYASFDFNLQLHLFMQMVGEEKGCALASFGDGELAIVRGHPIYNSEFVFDPSDKSHVEGRRLVIKALTNREDRYFVGIPCPCCQGDVFQEASMLGWGANLTYANLFVNSNYERFIRLSVPLFKSFKHVVFVGNEATCIGNLPFRVDSFHPVPLFAFGDHQRIVKGLLEEADRHPKALYIVAAGPLAKIVVFSVFRHDKGATCLDVGSVFDPMGLGHGTRDYHEGGHQGRLKCRWGEASDVFDSEALKSALRCLASVPEDMRATIAGNILGRLSETSPKAVDILMAGDRATLMGMRQQAVDFYRLIFEKKMAEEYYFAALKIIDNYCEERAGLVAMSARQALSMANSNLDLPDGEKALLMEKINSLPLGLLDRHQRHEGRICVVTTCYRGYKPLLKPFLGSLSRQERLPDEIVVVTDSVEECRESMLSGAPQSVLDFARRIRFVPFPSPLGAPFNKSKRLNLGAFGSDSETIFFTDCDCVYGRRTIGQILDRLGKDGAYVPVLPFDLNHDYLDRMGWVQELSYKASERVVEDVNRLETPHPNHGRGGMIAVRRKDFEAIGGYNEKLWGWGYEDEDFYRRLEASGVYSNPAQEAVAAHLWHRKEEAFFDQFGTWGYNFHIAQSRPWVKREMGDGRYICVKTKHGVDDYNYCKLFIALGYRPLLMGGYGDDTRPILEIFEGYEPYADKYNGFFEAERWCLANNQTFTSGLLGEVCAIFFVDMNAEALQTAREFPYREVYLQLNGQILDLDLARLSQESAGLQNLHIVCYSPAEYDIASRLKREVSFIPFHVERSFFEIPLARPAGASVLTVNQRLERTGCHPEVYAQVRERLRIPTILYGKSNEDSPFPWGGMVDFKTLPGVYGAHRLYLYMGTDPADYTYNFAEAMASGLAVVGYRAFNEHNRQWNNEIDRFLDNSSNGFYADSADAIAGRLNFLEQNPEVAKAVGGKAREFAKANFHPDIALALWRRLLSSGKPAVHQIQASAKFKLSQTSSRDLGSVGRK